MFGFSKEAVRVKVKKCEGKLQPELRKFSVDPQITSLEVLLSILIKAFDIKSDFTLLYRAQDDYGQEVYLPVLSDWDLEAAFLKSHNIASTNNAEPFLQLRVDMKPFSATSEDWEPPNIPIQEANLIYKDHVVQSAQLVDKQEASTGLQGLFMNQVGRTLTMVTRALNLHDDPDSPPRQPLNDMEFRSFLNAVGQINNTIKLKEVIYCGGIEPSLRKVVWKHILNVYPEGMTGKERMDFIKLKANEYYVLRTKWKDCIQKGKVNTTITYVTSMVRKDVLRTDRHHKFYAGSDDNQNVASLFNILTTYALNHPTVSYCQGMSDLASPLLMTMGDEAHAYVCLCALMARLHPNFLLDGQAMTLKFSHLSEALQLYDPEFYAYLKAQQADDLLFCYRWLLLEMKREFAFDDALRMLEVLWASLPQKNSEDLALKEQEFDPDVVSEDIPEPISPLIKTPRENAYTKVCAIRRQSSSLSLVNAKNPVGKRQKNYSLDESKTNGSDSAFKKSKEFQSLDEAKVQRGFRSNEHIDEVEPYNAQFGKSSPKISMLRKFAEAKKQDKIWSSTGNLAKETPLGSQIKLLKDKISRDESKFNETSNMPSEIADQPVKVIRNLNEFLNLANYKSVKKENINLSDNSISNLVDRSSQKSINSCTNEYKKNKRKEISNSVDSSPDDSQDYYPMTTSITRELRLELEHLDRQVFGSSYNDKKELYEDLSSSSSSSEYNKKSDNSNDSENSTNEHNADTKDMETIEKNLEDVFLWENPLHDNKTTIQTAVSSPLTPDEHSDIDNDAENLEKKDFDQQTIELVRKYSTMNITNCDNSNEHSKNSNEKTRSMSSQSDSLKSQKFFSSMSQELENAKRNCETMLNKPPNFHSMAATINTFQKKYDAFKSPVQSNITSVNSDGKNTIVNLPPPALFGGGNPFLMFLCLTLLLQHRDYIIRNRMDYNELAMHFDKMVRKHNVNRVLNQARQMYAVYLKHQSQKNSHVAT